jgi:hypothetical protein
MSIMCLLDHINYMIAAFIVYQVFQVRLLTIVIASLDNLKR